jgi:hypothetical protein
MAISFEDRNLWHQKLITFLEDISFVLTNKLLASLGFLNPQKIALSKPSDIELIAKKLFASNDNILR